MTGYLSALTESNASDALAQAKAERWRLEYWQHSDGLDVIAHRPYADGVAAGMHDMRQVHTMLLCPVAQRVFNS